MHPQQIRGIEVSKVLPWTAWSQNIYTGQTANKRVRHQRQAGKSNRQRKSFKNSATKCIEIKYSKFHRKSHELRLRSFTTTNLFQTWCMRRRILNKKGGKIL